jgi:hypothetical protein
MLKKVVLIGLVTAALMFQGTALWADDDAIMDVDDNAASFVGIWPTSKQRILYYGDDYQYAAGSGSGTQTHIATFTTAQIADITGQYHVYVRWTAGNQRGPSVYYRIYDNLNNYKGYCIKDQRYNGGAWQYCNTVTLNAGRRGVVKLGNENEPTNRYICADAVRFVRQSWDKGNLVGIHEPAGLSVNYRGTYSMASISSSSSSRTNIVYDGITPPESGYVIVSASGYAQHTTTGHWVHLCIDNTSGGSTCDSYTHTTRVASTTTYLRDRPFHIQEVYSVSGGVSYTFYLKAYRCCSSATGTVYLDDFILTFVPEWY